MTNIGTKYILAQKFIFDPYSNTLTDLNDNDEDSIVRLGSNESRILMILIDNPNQVVSRDQLHEYVWRDQGFQVDDSSLTQAISTLRKMLQDSTKSPQFIKTVPKRGYQLISEVEPATSQKQNEDISAALNEAEIMTTVADIQEPAIHQPIEITTSSAPHAHQPVGVKPEKTKTPLWIKCVWALSLAVPLTAWIASTPKSEDLVQVAMLDNVPLMLLSNQAEIDNWLPIIKKCTKSYQKDTSTPLTKVVTTGGSNDDIALNFIHDVAHSEENKTIVLFRNQTDFNLLCQ
ncbi:winged helix-turn-helix domain-containing protein [Vibrio aphrogenes]|uniref:winged helix-turn-helix domain-containing protein n=1 Tax=Vibrio aphrogenes TaxID=1891186 RepID=UPI000B35793F|nr:transcriptional regulator [Vibrio aphrogenes]